MIKVGITKIFIGINIRTIFDVINHVHEEDTSGLLAFLDFEKAFDKIIWQFVHKCLEHFGFGENFREWIKITLHIVK